MADYRLLFRNYHRNWRRRGWLIWLGPRERGWFDTGITFPDRNSAIHHAVDRKKDRPDWDFMVADVLYTHDKQHGCHSPFQHESGRRYGGFAA